MRGAKNSGQRAGGSGAGDDIQQAIDTLFQLPLGEFTAARNALAARVKKAGDAGEAARIKALPKPSVAAWAANQMYWKHRSPFDRLLDAGERFRRAQAAQLSGQSADIREPLEARRAALSELSARAADLLRQSDSASSPDTMRRITTTLEALSIYTGFPDAPRPGRLTDDVQPPGFETLAALVPRLDGGRASGPTRVLAFQQKTPRRSGAKSAGLDDEATRAAERRQQASAARAAVAAAERALRDARKAAHRAEEALKNAAARAKEADQEKQRCERQLEQAAAAADAARKHARAVAAQAEEAAQDVSDAERALDKAETGLASIIDHR